jgi:hypothetical protein
MTGPIHASTQLVAAMTHLGAAPRKRRTSRPGGAGDVAGGLPAGGERTYGLSAENLSAVIEALESEAYALRRAGTVASTAQAVLIQADDRLSEGVELAERLAGRTSMDDQQFHKLHRQVRDGRAAVVRLTRNAAFAGVPLFDGRYRLQVGGGKLELPDLRHSVPTLAALRILRSQVETFRASVIDPRLAVVEATLVSTAQTRSMVSDQASAHHAAARLRHAALAGDAGALVQPPSRGSLLDLVG